MSAVEVGDRNSERVQLWGITQRIAVGLGEGAVAVPQVDLSRIQKRRMTLQGQVSLAVGVEVSQRQRPGVRGEGVRSAGRKCPIPIVDVHEKRTVENSYHVCFAIAIQIIRNWRPHSNRHSDLSRERERCSVHRVSSRPDSRAVTLGEGKSSQGWTTSNVMSCVVPVNAHRTRRAECCHFVIALKEPIVHQNQRVWGA
jgi:hypothetical protein